MKSRDKENVNMVASLGSAPVFSTEPANPFPAVEGGNITLEWRYTFGQGGSFRMVIFGNTKIPTIADQSAGYSEPWIDSKYRSRLLAKITDNYTSVTLLGVSRTDSGSYKLTIINNPVRDRTTSTVEISVQCEYEKETKKKARIDSLKLLFVIFVNYCFFFFCNFRFIST